MGIRINSSNGILENNIHKAQKEVEDSLEKLSSGIRFTRSNPEPADRARSDILNSKIRELSVYKRSANDGLSFTELADSNLSLQTNMAIRMRELVAQSASPSLSDMERQFLFVEYQSLYKEMDRNALTTTYAGTNPISGDENGKKSLGFKIGSPVMRDGEDLSTVTIDKLDTVNARPENLGIISANDLASSRDGVSLDDVLDHFDADDEYELIHSFDTAQEKLAGYRAKFGAATSRLSNVLTSIDIAQENIAAANSRIRDVDYATEVSNLTRANILVQAGTSLLSQKQFQTGQTILSLIRGIEK